MDGYFRKAKESPKDIVAQVRDYLRFFFNVNDRDGWLRSKGFHIMVYGSIQYNDPRNLDADVLLVGEYILTLEPEERKPNRTKDHGLKSQWKTRDFGEEPHLSIFSLDSIENVADAIDTNVFDFDVAAMDASTALTGMPLYDQDNEWFRYFRGRLRKVVEADPLLTILVNREIESCLANREERVRAR